MNDIIYTDATCIASDMTQNWLSLEHADKANCSNGPKVMSVWLCNEVSIFFQSLVKISKHCQIRLKNASGTRAFWTILVNEECDFWTAEKCEMQETKEGIHLKVSDYHLLLN